MGYMTGWPAGSKDEVGNILIKGNEQRDKRVSVFNAVGKVNGEMDEWK